MVQEILLRSKKLSIVVCSIAFSMSNAQAALVASDNAGNPAYQADDAINTNDTNPANNTNGWVQTDNGGTGFSAYTFATTGAGGRYIGTSGVGTSPTFGLFAGGGTGNTSSFDRSFTGALSDGQTFSFNFGNTNVAAGGVIGLNLLDGTNTIFTIKFTGGGSTFQQNNGGTDFGIAQNFAANTPLAFSFKLLNGAAKTYDYTFGSASGSGFTGSVGNYANITGFRVFSNAQGSGENVGVNNFSVVPEPSTFALLAGASLLVVGMFLRRQRA